MSQIIYCVCWFEFPPQKIVLDSISFVHSPIYRALSPSQISLPETFSSLLISVAISGCPDTYENMMTRMTEIEKALTAIKETVKTSSGKSNPGHFCLGLAAILHSLNYDKIYA